MRNISIDFLAYPGAMLRPIPLPAPVTRATSPEKSYLIITSQSERRIKALGNGLGKSARLFAIADDNYLDSHLSNRSLQRIMCF